MPDRPPTILELAIAKVGIIKAGQVVTFLGFWAFCMNRDPEKWANLTLTDRVEEYRKVAAYSPSQAWRQLKRYRLVFDSEELWDPTVLVERVNLQIASKNAARDVMRVGNVQVVGQ